ncbi:hypothetical protein T01_4701 [Trichinella spiralis]|uniref:Uncharacterized protein n=1 Tax=Trichinella spiralis TaxID=6334 RepID=A0A0V1BG16_TRISP|nr:hypothetical protein T01_4701 [Trichinella spiralis]
MKYHYLLLNTLSGFQNTVNYNEDGYLACSILYLLAFTMLEILKDIHFDSHKRLLLHYSLKFSYEQLLMVIARLHCVWFLAILVNGALLYITLLSGSSFKESSLSKKVNLTYIIWLCLASAHQIHGALFPATTDNNSNANNDADKNHAHGDENPNPKSSNNYTTVGRSILSSAEVRQVLDIYTVGYRLPLV